MSYAYVMLQSCFLEVPIYLVFWVGLSWKRIAQIFVFNSITHPVVFFGIMNLPFTYLQNILLAEAFAIGIEALILMRLQMKPQRAWIASSVANLTSWQLAPLLTYWIWA